MRRFVRSAALLGLALGMALVSGGVARAQEPGAELEIGMELGESVELVLPTPPRDQLRGADIRVHASGGAQAPRAIPVKTWQPGRDPAIALHDWRDADASRIRLKSWQPFRTPAIRVHGAY